MKCETDCSHRCWTVDVELIGRHSGNSAIIGGLRVVCHIHLHQWLRLATRPPAGLHVRFWPLYFYACITIAKFAKFCQQIVRILKKFKKSAKRGQMFDVTWQMLINSVICWVFYIKTSKNVGDKIFNFSESFEFGARQKYVNLLALRNMLQNENSLTKVGFDTTENEPSKSKFLYFLIPQVFDV